MRRFPIAVGVTIALLLGLALAASRANRVPNVKDSTGAVTLPNGWRITPAGKHVKLPGDLPMKMQVLGDGSILVLTAGYHDHSLNAIDVRTGKVTATLDVVKAWDGMAFDAASGTVFLSGGGRPRDGFEAIMARMGLAAMKDSIDKPILRVRYADGKLTPLPALCIQGLDEAERYISGVTLGPDGSLYALNIQTDTLYRLSGPDFARQSSAKTGYRPYGVAFSPDGKMLAVTNWGDRSVSLLDPASLRETARIAVGSHPNEMAWSSEGRLFVANSGSNEVSVISGGAVVETIRTSLDPKAPVGSTPDALALSSDGRRLYVTNADNNNVAVVDVSNAKESRVLGFIPTGWYPTALAVSADGRQLYVGTGKGMGFRNNFPAVTRFQEKAPNPATPYDYIPAILSGHVSIVDVPDARQLAAYTRQAGANVPVPGSYVDAAWASKIRGEVFPKIRHVLYIIRENRTYDQVLGDLGTGNGDPKLTLFGAKVTPNAHALARRTVNLDNLYCDGEVSEDGHQWCDAAYATDFTEKAWVNSYSRRAEPKADERLTASPAGYIWDACARKGLTYRTYGEMAGFISTRESAPQVRAAGSLAGHVSAEWQNVRRTGNGRDTDRAAVFISELREAEKTGEWPSFMVMALAEDHTQGLTPKAFNPIALVGGNDLALGRIVEAVSHSRFWKETAIFVIEDDAQNGPDHVDAHRTVGLVISPWSKRGVVDSTMYTTSSMVRTMELILGLDPMTQFDAAATPMYASFTTEPAFEAIDALPAQVDLTARNPDSGPGVQASLKLDFSDVDRADPDELNQILWAALKPGAPMPAPVHGTLVRQRPSPPRERP
jgi:YVTN family beta-propeller protein